MAKLTVLQVNKVGPGRHADGDGLYLLVKPSGARSWVLRVQSSGRRRDFGLGPVSLVSLSEAREKAREARKLARSGRDPSAQWHQERTTRPTFKEAAEQYYEIAKRGWRNGKHQGQWISTLRKHAFPSLGNLPVDQIDAAAIQSVLLPIWLDLPETAGRVRQRIAKVLNYAHGQGWRAAEAPMQAVATGLPRRSAKVEHFAAMPFAGVPAFMKKLEADGTSVGRLALRFAILTAARSGEVRGAKWSEIDWAARLWNIPGDRMKAGEPHSIPLSEPALAILLEAKKLNGLSKGGFIFPGLSGGPLSDMTLTKALRAGGGDGFTVHGFRSSFRDWIAERTSFPGDWAEAALAHSIGNRVEAAYRRTRFLDQRRGLMADWAAFVSGDNVVDIRRRA